MYRPFNLGVEMEVIKGLPLIPPDLQQACDDEVHAKRTELVVKKRPKRGDIQDLLLGESLDDDLEKNAIEPVLEPANG